MDILWMFIANAKRRTVNVPYMFAAVDTDVR